MLLVALLMLAWSSCGPTQSGVKLRNYEATHAPDEFERRRASFDLQCPPEQTKLWSIDAMSLGARGCGRQLRYMKRCRRCQWEPAGSVTNLISQ
jgi:hypothetical protein